MTAIGLGDVVSCWPGGAARRVGRSARHAGRAGRGASGAVTRVDRLFFGLGAASGFVAVAAGAFGAHALRARLSADLLAVFETGARYQMYHALALLAVAWAAARWPGAVAEWAGWLFVGGHRAVLGQPLRARASGVRWLGAITPLGGVAFLAGWICLALAVGGVSGRAGRGRGREARVSGAAGNVTQWGTGAAGPYCCSAGRMVRAAAAQPRDGALPGRVQRVLPRPLRHLRGRRGAGRARRVAALPPGERGTRSSAAERAAGSDARVEPGWAPPYAVAALGEQRFDRLTDASPSEPCPLLDDAGRCRIYADRPLVCRLIGLGMRRRRPRDRERLPDPGPIPGVRRIAADAVRAGRVRGREISACAPPLCGGSGTWREVSRRRSPRWWQAEGGRAGVDGGLGVQARKAVIPSAARDLLAGGSMTAE